MGKLGKFIIAAMVVVGVSKTVQKVMGLDEQSKWEAMEKMVADLNAKAPNKVDEITTFTGASLTKQEIKLNYRLAGVHNFTGAQLAQFESAAVKQVCGGPMKVFASNNMTVKFKYLYEMREGMHSGIFPIDIAVPPQRCTSL